MFDKIKKMKDWKIQRLFFKNILISNDEKLTSPCY